MRVHYCAAIAFSLAVASNADAQGESEIGKTLAGQHCVRCHDIEPGGAFKEHPPSFASIAVFRPPEQIHGRIAFPTRHANMPQIGYVLSPGDIEHLVAYIMSLEAQSQ